MTNFYALVLAGGGGTRLWPMSRREKPKQMQPLIGERTMFKTSIKRLAPLFLPEQVFVSTARNYVEDLQTEVPDIPAQNYIVEPSARNNAAAVGLAMTVIHARDPDAVIAMLTSDHHIGRVDKFRQVLHTAGEIAREGKIVTLGIAPDHPSTGFGYIQQGQHLGEKNGFEYYRAERFTEKPDVVRATQFIASGKYSWNSGMFIWTAERALSEFQQQQPAMYDLFQQLRPAIDTDDYSDVLNRIWDDMPRLSIDYAVMEDASDMVVIPVEIGWNDVGTWSSLYDVLPQDKFGNCGKDDAFDNRVVLDTRDTMIYTDKLAVAIGVDNIIVVETDDVIMVCHKDRAQDVREIVKYLRENGKADYT
jgi:mannose-1-phosphate guanylyltransferase